MGLIGIKTHGHKYNDGCYQPKVGLNRMAYMRHKNRGCRSFMQITRPIRLSGITLRFGLKSLALVAGVVVLTCVRADGEVMQCSVNGSPPSAEINLAAPLQGQLDLYVVCPTSPSRIKTITVSLTKQFQGDGGSVPVDLLLPPDYKAAKDSQTIDFTPPLVHLRLAVSRFPAVGKYSGLLVMAPQGKDALLWKIILSRGAPSATLVVSQPSPWQVTRPFLGWREEFGPLRKLLYWPLKKIGWCPAEDPLFSVTLWEKSGQASLEGISVRLEQVSKQPERGFSLGRNVEFTFKDHPIADFEVLPGRPGEDRSIAAGPAPVGMRFKFLQTGEYNFFLTFHALNSVLDDSQQKVNLVIQVRDSYWWAVLWLVSAVAVSFVSFKLLSSLRHRYDFLRQLRDLRPPWLAGEPQVLAIVLVSAALKQTEDLSERFWLTGADQVDVGIARLKSMVAILGEIRETRLKLEDAGLPRLLYIRALGKLNKIVSRLGEAGLDDAALPNLNADLTAFGDWLGPDANRDKCYWTDLCGAIKKLLDEISLADITDTHAWTKMNALQDAIMAKLDPAPPPPDLKGKMAVERQYAALKIVWERHKAHEFKALVNLIPPHSDIDDAALKAMFTLADAKAWEQIKTAKVEIEMPASDGPDPPQAYKPLRFELRVHDSALNGAYLFQHGLQFQWTLTFEYKSSRLRKLMYKSKWLRKRVRPPRTFSLEPVSTEPRVVQYVPRSGRLTAKVEVKNVDDSFEVPAASLPLKALSIAPSSDFGTFKGLAHVEKISWAMAALIAVVTGLSTFYFKGPTFGSFQDYLSLFLWGAGVDQGKNFLQVLQTYSPSKQS